VRPDAARRRAEGNSQVPVILRAAGGIELLLVTTPQPHSHAIYVRAILRVNANPERSMGERYTSK
jgi:hypothetical protein